MKRSILFALLAVVALLGWCSIPQEKKRGQVEHTSLESIRVYAYRDWQSTSMRVREGELLDLEAGGNWLYTPGEYHGPKGHPHYASPTFYPLPGVPGGALIARIGESGKPRYVGERQRWQAERDGLLYLRIDDDILSDNEGYVTVKVRVSPVQE
jgi:hypothetical protein